MALATKRFFSFRPIDADGAPVPDAEEGYVDVVYDDTDLRVRSIRTYCPSVSGWSFACRLSRPDRSRGINVIRLPGTDVTVAIPTTVANRLQLVTNAKGAVIGLEGDLAYPATNFS